MLMIRLQRLGKKKQPYYRLIVSEKGRDTQAGSLEILGIYHPLAKEKDKIFQFKEERVKHWLSKGAKTSDTVHNFLAEAGAIGEPKKKMVTISRKRQLKKEKKEAQN